MDKYTWVAEGSSYVLSDVLAAILDAQLDKLAEIQARRRGWSRALPRAARRMGGAQAACGCRPSCPTARPTTTSSP